MKNIRILATLFAVLVLAATASAQSKEQLVDVVATGHGSTVREATKAALRSAVEAVVGTMVDATTLVQNDELIENEVLSYSAGMIASVKTIGEPKKSADGLYTVKVKASVKKGRIEEKLRAASVVNVTLDGADLFARMTAAKDNLSDAEAMIKSVFAKHIGCVIAETVPGKNGKSPIDIDPKTGEVFVNIRVRVDQTKYTQFANEVVEKLSSMAEKKVKIKAKGIFESEPYGPDQFNISMHRDHCQFRIMTSIRTGSAVAFQLDKNILNAVLKCLDTGSLGVEVTLYDVQGNEIARSDIALCERRNDDSRFISIFTCDEESGGVMPFYFGNNYHGFSLIDHLKHEGTYKLSLGTFTPEELKSFGKSKIKVGHMKKGQFTD